MREFSQEYARIIEGLLKELEDVARGSSKPGKLTRSPPGTSLKTTGLIDADSVLLKLYHVFGPMLASALQLVDKGSGGLECGRRTSRWHI